MKKTLCFILMAILFLCAACQAPEVAPQAPPAVTAVPETPLPEALERERQAKIDAVNVILADAYARRESILTSQTAIVKGDAYLPGETYSGKAYYVSNGGDDHADGLSPEHAWATVLRVNQAQLEHGDAVFFERGGLWREQLDCREKVTYSAYGVGAKPRFYGSMQNGAGVENWTLYAEEGNAKIWLFNFPITDCSGVVFNDGASYASRVYAHWDGKQLTSLARPGEPLDPVKDLAHDRQFTHTFEMPADAGEYVDAFSVDTTGQLYLRMDEGNPGELYDVIEFQVSNNPLAGYVGIVNGCWNDSGCVADNLCMMYSGWIGINFFGASNSVIQNCEVAWCGGNTQAFQREGNVQAAGEGLKMEANNIVTRNNYVHDCFDGGIISEAYENGFSFYGSYLHGQRITGNLIERCMSGILITHDYEESTEPLYGDIIVEDNIILYSGYGWSGDDNFDCTWATEDYDGTAITFWDDIVRNDGIYLTGNVLAFANSSLLHCGMPDEWLPVCAGNTFVQSAGHAIGYYRRSKDVGFWHGKENRAASQAEMEKVVHETFNDPDGVAYYLDEILYR